MFFRGWLGVRIELTVIFSAKTSVLTPNVRHKVKISLNGVGRSHLLSVSHIG